MRLDDFIATHDVMIAEKRVDAGDIKTVEQDIRKSFIRVLGDILSPDEIVQKEKEYPTVFGPGFRKFLIDYGYLQFGNVYLGGLDKTNLLSSNMVAQTKFFHKHYPATWGKFFLEECKRSYAFVSSDDEVFMFDTTKDGFEGLTDTGMDINEYMLQRLSVTHGDRLYKDGEIETFEEALSVFEQDMTNHNLPDFGQPTAKEVMAKKKEKSSWHDKKQLMDHMQLPSKGSLTEQCMKLINSNYNIPAEIDIWVDKCIAYYFPHGIILNNSKMVMRSKEKTEYYLDPGQILKPLYKYKGYKWYTWKEIYKYIIY